MPCQDTGFHIMPCVQKLAAQSGEVSGTHTSGSSVVMAAGMLLTAWYSCKLVLINNWLCFSDSAASKRASHLAE